LARGNHAVVARVSGMIDQINIHLMRGTFMQKDIFPDARYVGSWGHLTVKGYFWKKVVYKMPKIATHF
jgi:hypothetical protein